jgi:uncharacterized protein YjbJ (UPF0337 family)
VVKNADEVKGRIKEAGGDLTGNKDLKREGQTDRAAGRAKEVVGNLEEKAKNTVDALKDRVHQLSRDK